MIIKLFVLFVLLVIIPDVYIYWVHVRHSKSKLFKRLYWIPGLVLLIGLPAICFIPEGRVLDQYARELGWLIMFFFICVVPKVIFMFFSILASPILLNKRWPGSFFITVGLLLSIASEVLLLYGTFIGKNRFVVKEVDFVSEHLPDGFDGYRIMQLSDMHLGSWKWNKKNLDQLIDLCNEQEANITVFTGDLVNHSAYEIEGFEPFLAKFKQRDAFYSILGNHDYVPYFKHVEEDNKQEEINFLIKKQREAGWDVLMNENRLLLHNGDTIALIGVENYGEPPFSQHGDLKKAMLGTSGRFKILLSHNPTHWRSEVLGKTDIDLMLAGHTHGMQLIVGGFSFASKQYSEWNGFYQQGSQGLYVNLGVGVIGIPFRFGAWPEVTIITLRKP